jgi:acetylornithine deacetylase
MPREPWHPENLAARLPFLRRRQRLAAETRAFLDPVLRRQGIDPEPIGVPYGTDASLFSAANLNCIVIGPGDIAQAHTADEWIELEQLDRACALFRDIAMAPAP